MTVIDEYELLCRNRRAFDREMGELDAALRRGEEIAFYDECAVCGPGDECECSCECHGSGTAAQRERRRRQAESEAYWEGHFGLRRADGSRRSILQSGFTVWVDDPATGELRPRLVGTEFDQ